MNRARRHSGFTLLEIILAMTLVSMLALSLYVCMRIGFTARRHATEAVEPVRAAEEAMEMIRQDLESALSPTGTLAGPFLGQHDTTNVPGNDILDFYCVGEGPDRPDPPGQGGVRLEELAVVPMADGLGNALVRRIAPSLPAPPVQTDPDQEVICRGVRTFTIRYWDGYIWQEIWDSTQTQPENLLPQAVQIILELDWPPSNRPADTRTPPTYRTVRTFLLASYHDPNTETQVSGGTTSTGTGTGTGTTPSRNTGTGGGLGGGGNTGSSRSRGGG